MSSGHESRTRDHLVDRILDGLAALEGELGRDLETSGGRIAHRIEEIREQVEALREDDRPAPMQHDDIDAIEADLDELADLTEEEVESGAATDHVDEIRGRVDALRERIERQ